MSTTSITNHLDSLDREAYSKIEEETSLQRQIILRRTFDQIGSRANDMYAFKLMTGSRHDLNPVIFEHGGNDEAGVWQLEVCAFG